MLKNYFRVAANAPHLYLGNVRKNCDEIEKLYREYQDKADLILTPELSLCGYTCQDLFSARSLIHDAEQGLFSLARLTAEYGDSGAVLAVGLPFYMGNELFNCAAMIHNGKILALIPKTYLPNHDEFYEKRWFSAGTYDAREITLSNGEKTVFGNKLILKLFDGDNTVSLGVEICEDAWAPVPPSTLLAMQGAEIILNLSASNEVIGKAQYRRSLVGNISSGSICGYVYVSSGMYESTSDMVFGGHCLMYENGTLKGEIAPFENGVLIRDFSLSKLRHDRIRNRVFPDCKQNICKEDYSLLSFNKTLIPKSDLASDISITPFVPEKERGERSKSIFDMQVAGLMRRIVATNCKHIVVGVSGGLDSTLALLVAAEAVRRLGLPSQTVLGITMPGFGTTGRTKANSLKLMELLGCEYRTISISEATLQHFRDIGQDENVHDITYENCQARERTQVLMDVANKEGGFVLGTGDLSELALGWCTYNGDHMSMYAVNASIPKTLVRTLVDEIGHSMARNGIVGLDSVIEDIIDTPVSPELLPPNPDGTIAQKTEDTVGSYILHDFFLYYMLRYGMDFNEIYELCKIAVARSDTYKFSDAEIQKWLKTFRKRFFRQQFKRNCMPDCVKVGTVSLSPRGDLRLPSEIDFDELEF